MEVERRAIIASLSTSFWLCIELWDIELDAERLISKLEVRDEVLGGARLSCGGGVETTGIEGNSSPFEVAVEGCDGPGEMPWICEGSLLLREGTAARCGRRMGDLGYIGDAECRIC